MRVSRAPGRVLAQLLLPEVPGSHTPARTAGSCPGVLVPSGAVLSCEFPAVPWGCREGENGHGGKMSRLFRNVCLLKAL